MVGLWDTVTTSPVEVIGNVVNAALHPVRTYDIVKTAIVQSYERDMVHGNAYTRSRWVTYALAMAAASAVGTKGVNQAGKVADLAKLSSRAGPLKNVSRIAARDSGPKSGLQAALAGAGGTPYNVIHSAGLRDKLLAIAGQNRGKSFFNQLNRARDLIQQARTKGVDSVNVSDKPSSLVGREVELGWLGDNYKAIEIKGSVKVGGKDMDISRRIYQKNDINWDYIPKHPRAKGLSNRELAAKGKPTLCR